MLLKHFQYFVQLLQPNPFLNLPSLPLHDVPWLVQDLRCEHRCGSRSKAGRSCDTQRRGGDGEDLTVKMRGNEGWKMRRYVYLHVPAIFVCCGCEFTDVCRCMCILIESKIFTWNHAAALHDIIHMYICIYIYIYDCKYCIFSHTHRYFSILVMYNCTCLCMRVASLQMCFHLTLYSSQKCVLQMPWEWQQAMWQAGR